MNARHLVLFAALFAVSSASASGQSPAPVSSNAPNFAYDVVRHGIGGPSNTMSLDVFIASTDADGSRRGSVLVHAAKMPVDNKRIDATISPAGSIALASTGSMPAHFNPFSPGDIKAANQMAIGPMVQMMIGPINTFADALARAPAKLQPGTSWHAFSMETGSDVIYTVLGREQRNGRDVVTVEMKSDPSGQMQTSGKGYYDAAAHLVVALHSEMGKQSGSPQQVVDVSLK